ncbi:MAG: hypothetical protein ABIH72_01115 [archaeon]
MDLKEAYSNWENLLVIIASIVLIIAAFLTWASGSFSAELSALAPNLESQSISGIGMKFGYVSAGCGVIAIALLFFRKSKILTIILGVVAFLTAGLIWIYTTKVIPSKTVDVVMNNGLGVYLTMIAAISLIIGGFLIKKSDTVKKK